MSSEFLKNARDPHWAACRSYHTGTLVTSWIRFCRLAGASRNTSSFCSMAPPSRRAASLCPSGSRSDIMASTGGSPTRVRATYASASTGSINLAFSYPAA